MSPDDQNKMTDEELLVRSITERDFFRYIVTRYEQKLQRYLRRIVPGLGEDCDDVLQEVFVKIYLNARGFDPSLSFSSWAYRIAHNEAVNWLRYHSRRPHMIELGEEEFHTFVKSMTLDARHQETHLVADAVGRILSELSEQHREVLVLKFIEGLSYEEISDILRIPEATVGTQIYRAKQSFIKLYDKHHE